MYSHTALQSLYQETRKFAIIKADDKISIYYCFLCCQLDGHEMLELEAKVARKIVKHFSSIFNEHIISGKCIRVDCISNNHVLIYMTLRKLMTNILYEFENKL